MSPKTAKHNNRHSIVHVQTPQMLYRCNPQPTIETSTHHPVDTVKASVPHQRPSTFPIDAIHDPYSAFALVALPIDPTLPLVFLTPFFPS